MSRITYTALRELEKTIVVSGAGISVNPVDDSFNAASGLGGFLANEWAYVSGFANAANNGWFQLKSNSTSAKIVEVTAPFTHLRFPGVASNFASTPDSGAISILSDSSLRVRVAPNDWTPAAIAFLDGQWGAAGQRARKLELLTDGKLRYSWTTNGTTVIAKDSTVSVGFADGSTNFVMATHDVDNGATGNDVKFWTSADGSNWTQLGTTVTTAGVTSVANSNAALSVGAEADGTTGVWAGRIYYADVRATSGTGGAAAAAFEPNLGSRTSLTWNASTGELWTVGQSGSPPAELQGRALVTEAAGPVVTIQGYKRGLGVDYNLEFYSEQVERSVQLKRSQQQPMGGGAPEVLFMRREEFFDVTVIGPLGDPLTEAEMPQWREFFASVEGGELFTLDRYGTLISPVEPRSAILSSESYAEARVASMRRYRLSFQVRVL